MGWRAQGGVFGARMSVKLVNDGPVTVLWRPRIVHVPIVRRLGVAVIALGLFAPAADAAMLSREGTTIVFHEEAASVTVNDIHVLTSSGEQLIGDEPPGATTHSAIRAVPTWATGTSPAPTSPPSASRRVAGTTGSTARQPRTAPRCRSRSTWPRGTDSFLGGLAGDTVRGGPGQRTHPLRIRGQRLHRRRAEATGWRECQAATSCPTLTRTEPVTVDLGAAGLFPHGSATDGAPVRATTSRMWR